MNQTIFIAIFIISLSTFVFANKTADEKSAAEVPDKLFAAMKAKKPDVIKSLFIEGGHLVAIQKPRSGNGDSSIRNFTIDGFAKMFSQPGGPELIEKMPEKDVRIEGDMAVVAGRYTFYVGKKLSHCGMNTFNLARVNGTWKIANAATTIEPTSCEKDMKAIEIPEIEADPKDVSSIDGIVKALYETISGGVGKPRQWGRDRTLYTPDVRFTSISTNEKGSRISRVSHQQYVNNSDEFMVKSGFTEREINRVTRRFGNIAQVFSTYEWETADKERKGRGINSIELFFDGKRWWISALAWENEHKGNPIPKEFLKQ